jgi:hypothetical protein
MSRFIALVRPSLTPALFFAWIALAGCEGGPVDDGGGDELRDEVGTAPAPGPDADVPLHPCGNGVLDDGEECDDGPLNGPRRACTSLCRINECELDERGECEGHWPAADVDLYPCDPDLETFCIDE